MKKLVLASANPGKLREFGQILAGLGIEVISQSALDIGDAEEPHQTFVENALAKARHAARHSRLPALADDSGICASALHGQPGVRSARFADEPPGASSRDEQDRRNNEKLVRLLRDQKDRRAHYSCCIVMLRHDRDPEPLIAQASWAGEIVEEPRGSNGFGYDPHFLLPDLGKTAAELDSAQKNLISHRGKALRRLIAGIREGA